MRGSKYKSGVSNLKSRQFSHAPAVTRTAGTSSISHQAKSMTKLSNTQASLIKPNSFTQSALGLRRGSQNNYRAVVTSSSQSQLAFKKKSTQVSILLRNITQRQSDEAEAASKMQDDSNKKLAEMQLANFLQPTQGVGVGIKVRDNQKGDKSSKNFLHARMFARNLGIESRYNPRAFPRTEPSTFSHSRFSTNLQSTMQGDLRGNQLQPTVNEEDLDYSNPTIQGQRVAVRFPDRQRQQPYNSKNLLYQRPGVGEQMQGQQQPLVPAPSEPKQQLNLSHLLGPPPYLQHSSFKAENTLQMTDGQSPLLNYLESQRNGLTKQSVQQSVQVESSPSFDRARAVPLFNQQTVSPQDSSVEQDILNSPKSPTFIQGRQGGILKQQQLSPQSRSMREASGDTAGNMKDEGTSTTQLSSPHRHLLQVDEQPCTAYALGSNSATNNPNRRIPASLARMARNSGVHTSTNKTQLLSSKDDSIDNNSCYTLQKMSNGSHMRQTNQMVSQQSEKRAIRREIAAATGQVNVAALSQNSKQSLLNQTPGMSESHLKAKYAEQSFVYENKEQELSNRMENGTSKKLPSIEEQLRQSQSGGRSPSPLSPARGPRLQYRQQVKESDSSPLLTHMRCMTPPVNSDHKNGTDQSILFSNVQPWVNYNSNKDGKLTIKTQQIPITKDVQADFQQKRRAIYTADGDQQKRKQYRSGGPMGEDKRKMQMWQSLGHAGADQNQIVNSHNQALLAKTDGNVNISAILVQARHNKLHQREQSGSPEGFKVNQMQDRATSKADCSNAQSLKHQTRDSDSIPSYSATIVNQKAWEDTQATCFQNNKRTSVGQIDFGKPVNKLVSNVAKAIGESVRRMQPRSVQRSAYEKRDEQRNPRRQLSRTGQTSKAGKRQTIGGRFRVENQRRMDQAQSKNNLISKITKITMASHNEITENQILKLNLDLLKSEQMQQQQVYYPDFSNMLPTPQHLRHESQVQDHSYASQTPYSGAGSIVVKSTTDNIVSNAFQAEQSAAEKKSSNRITPELSMHSKWPDTNNRILNQEDKLPVCVTQDSLEINVGSSREKGVKLSTASPKKDQCSNGTQNGILQVMKKPILAASPTNLKGVSSKTGKSSSQKRPTTTLKPGQIVVESFSTKQATRQNQYQTTQPLQSPKGVDSASDEEHIYDVVTIHKAQDIKSGESSAAVGQERRSVDIDCSTAREVNLMDTRGADSPLIIRENKHARNHKRQHPQLTHNESMPATIYTEPGQTRKITPPKTSLEDRTSLAIAARSMCGLEIGRAGREKAAAEQPHSGEFTNNITPQVRQFAESALAPVYDLGTENQIKMQDIYPNLNSGSNADLSENLLSPKHQTQLISSNKQLQAESMQSRGQPAKLGFEGLLIKSQGFSIQGQQKNDYGQISSQYSTENAQRLLSQTQSTPAANRQQNGVSQYATTTPNRWLQDAIRRGKKLRKDARQQVTSKNIQSLVSPVSSQGQLNRDTDNSFCVGEAIIPELYINRTGGVQNFVSRQQSQQNNTSSSSKKQWQNRRGRLRVNTGQTQTHAKQLASEEITQIVLVQGQNSNNTIRYKPYAQGGIKSGNQNPLSTRRKSAAEQKPNEAVMLMVMDKEQKDNSVEKIKVENIIAQGVTIDDDCSPNPQQSMVVLTAELSPVDQRQFEELALMKEMQNLQDYNSQFADINRSSQARQELSQQHNDSSDTLLHHKPSMVSQVHFKVLPSKVHKLGSETRLKPSSSQQTRTNKIYLLSEAVKNGPVSGGGDQYGNLVNSKHEPAKDLEASDKLMKNSSSASVNIGSKGVQSAQRQQHGNTRTGHLLRNSENQRPPFHGSKSQKQMQYLKKDRMSLQVLGNRCAALLGQSAFRRNQMPGSKGATSADPSRLSDYDTSTKAKKLDENFTNKVVSEMTLKKKTLEAQALTDGLDLDQAHAQTYTHKQNTTSLEQLDITIKEQILITQNNRSLEDDFEDELEQCKQLKANNIV